MINYTKLLDFKWCIPTSQMNLGVLFTRTSCCPNNNSFLSYIFIELIRQDGSAILIPSLGFCSFHFYLNLVSIYGKLNITIWAIIKIPEILFNFIILRLKPLTNCDFAFNSKNSNWNLVNSITTKIIVFCVFLLFYSVISAL
jgi:hypothetical protein